MSDQGRSKVVSMSRMDAGEVLRGVEAYRQWRRARARMVQSFQELLEAVEELGRLRTVSLERLRRSRGRLR